MNARGQFIWWMKTRHTRMRRQVPGQSCSHLLCEVIWGREIVNHQRTLDLGAKCQQLGKLRRVAHPCREQIVHTVGSLCLMGGEEDETGNAEACGFLVFELGH